MSDTKKHAEGNDHEGYVEQNASELTHGGWAAKFQNSASKTSPLQDIIAQIPKHDLQISKVELQKLIVGDKLDSLADMSGQNHYDTLISLQRTMIIAKQLSANGPLADEVQKTILETLSQDFERLQFWKVKINPAYLEESLSLQIHQDTFNKHLERYGALSKQIETALESLEKQSTHAL